MPQNERAPRTAKIYIPLMIDIVQMRSFPFFKKDGWTLYTFECPDRRVNASRKIAFGLLKVGTTFAAVKGGWSGILCVV
jgi:hypothetical protein